MLVVRSSLPPARVAGFARSTVAAVNRDVQVMEVVPFATLLDAPLARPRFNARAIGIFAFAALLLAAVGVYAVMAAYVGQRYTESASASRSVQPPRTSAASSSAKGCGWPRSAPQSASPARSWRHV